MAYDTTEAQHASSAQTSSMSGPRAGFWVRLGAALIDSIILSVVLFAVVGGLALVSETLAVIAYLVAIVALHGYYVYFEGGPTGQTLGKKALNIRVYDLKQGGSIGYGRAFLRLIGRNVSFIVIFLGYLWMLWDKEKQTWHDKGANSVVGPVSAYPVQK